MISNLSVRNFKSLKDISLPLGNINLFFGPNNSGKSSIFQSLIYLKYAGSENWDRNRGQNLKLSETGFDLSDPEGIFHRNGEKQSDFLEIRPKIQLRGSRKFDKIREMKEGTDFEDIYLEECWVGFRFGEKDWNPIYESGSSEPVPLIEKKNGKARLPRTEEPINAEFHKGYLNFGLAGDQAKSKKDLILKRVQEIVEKELEKIHYISERRMVEDWQADPRKYDFVGIRGENTVSMLHGLRDEEEKFYKIVDVVSSLSSDIDELRADMHNSDTRTELKDSDTGELLNLIASGSGLKRNLPIIVQAVSSEDGDTLLIEEPEISLYPASQRHLADLLVERASEGVQMLITTHSFYFVTKLKDAIKENDLGEDEVKAYRVNKKGGETKAKEVGITSAVNQMQDLVGFSE